MMSCCSNKCQDYEMWAGLLLFVVGAVFLLQRFDLIPAETWFYLWPILLVVFGVKLMISGGSTHACEMPMPSAPVAKTTPAMPKSAPKKAAPKKRQVASAKKK